MTCPTCGAVAAVACEIPEPRAVRRLRTCTCGKSWPTIERFVVSKVGAAHDKHVVKPLSKHVVKHVVKINGGLIGGLDPGLPLGSVSGSDPEEVSANPDARARKGRGDAAQYPADFEELWVKTGRHGNKHPAFQVWEKIKPPVDLNTLVERWREWEGTDQWRAGFVPHLRKWLFVRGWQDPPPEHEFTRKGGAPARGAALNVQHAATWLAAKKGEG